MTQPLPAPRPGTAPSAYWLCQGAGWMLLAVLAVGLNAAGGAHGEVLARLCGVYLCSASGGIALSHGWRGWLRRARLIEIPGLHGWLSMAPALMLLSVAMALVTALGFQLFQPFGPLRGWQWLPGALVSWVGILTIWTLLYAVTASARRARQLREDGLRHKAEAREAELRALQAKVNPHFFFNSLNSLRGLVFEDRAAAARMIDQLAALMRYSLGSSEQRTVSLADELAAVRAYLAIEQIRFEERLRVHIEVEPGLAELQLPPMTVQTLVENAVKYGVEPNPAGSEVRIGAARVGAQVALTVANQGALSAAGGARDSTRIGLDNVAQRLALALPTPAQVTLSESDDWVTACIRLEAGP